VAWADYAAVFALLAPLLLAAERANPETGERGRPAPVLRRRGTDWAFVGLQLTIVPAIGVGLARGAPELAARSPLHGAVVALPAWLAVVLAFGAADFAAYWAHRAEHRFACTWRFHSVHHSPRQLDWLAGRRFHPLDVLVQLVAPVGVASGLGFGLGALAPYLFTAGLVTLLAHADVRLPAGWWARAVVTTGYHRSHHEQGREGTNFALVLPFMDIVFGTASFEVGRRRFGTEGDVPGSGFWALLRWGVGAGRVHRAKTAMAASPVPRERALAT